MSEQESTTKKAPAATKKQSTSPFIVIPDNAGDELIVHMSDVYLYGSNLINKYTNSTIMHVGLEHIEAVRAKLKG